MRNGFRGDKIFRACCFNISLKYCVGKHNICDNFVFYFKFECLRVASILSARL